MGGYVLFGIVKYAFLGKSHSLFNVTSKVEVKNAEIFTKTHPLGVKISTEHAGAIIFKPKSSKAYEFLHFFNNNLYTKSCFI